jgi:hypothetical protein
MTVAANNHLYEMENLARMQVVATLAASIIVARNATEMADLEKAWADASRIALPPGLRS